MVVQADGINLDSSAGTTFPGGTDWELDSGGNSFYTVSDFIFKWEKTDSGGVVTEIDQTIFSGNIVLNSLLILSIIFCSFSKSFGIILFFSCSCISA